MTRLLVGAFCLLAVVGVVEAALLPSAQIFNVVSQQDNMEFYTIDGMQNPALTLTRGNTYVFMLPDSSDHPFWITTQAHSIRGDNAYTNGVVYNGVAHRVGNVTFTVPLDAPDLLHYDCQYHASMTGPLSIIWGLSPGVHNNGIEKGTIMFLVPLSAPDTLYYNCQYHPDMTAVITIQDHTDKSPPLNVTTVFNVTHDFALAYMMGGKHNPALTLLRGHTYQFNLDCEGHPFNIKVVQGVGVTGRYIYHGVGGGVVGSVPTRIIVHGIVNSIAWVILLPLGILMARYGKGAIGHKTFWFLFHRACQCVAVIACAVGWSLGSFWVCGSDTYECNSPTPHALVGTFITVVALVQPVNAFIRPHVHADHEVGSSFFCSFFLFFLSVCLCLS